MWKMNIWMNMMKVKAIKEQEEAIKKKKISKETGIIKAREVEVLQEDLEGENWKMNLKMCPVSMNPNMRKMKIIMMKVRAGEVTEAIGKMRTNI